MKQYKNYKSKKKKYFVGEQKVSLENGIIALRMRIV
jgi:hypothetical protein